MSTGKTFGWQHINHRKDVKVENEGTNVKIKVHEVTNVYRYSEIDEKPMSNMPFYFTKFFGDFTVNVLVKVANLKDLQDAAGILVKPSKPFCGVFLTCALEHHSVTEGLGTNFACSKVCTKPPEQISHQLTPRNDCNDSVEKDPNVSFVYKGLEPEIHACWFRVKRRGNSFSTHYSIDDDENFKELWEGDFVADEGVQVGLFGACPSEDHHFTVKFEKFTVFGH